MNNMELYHYGVRGMRWGVRKERFSISTRRKQRASASEKYNRAVYREYRSRKSVNVAKTLVNAAGRQLIIHTVHKKAKQSGIDWIANNSDLMATHLTLLNVVGTGAELLRKRD